MARDITWVNSAGNSAEDTWFGSFTDHDGDGEMSFNSSGDEINILDLRECRRYALQLRWEDTWGGADTDLDMFLYDTSTGEVLDIPREWGIVGSVYEQSGASYHEPFEFIFLRSPIDSMDVGVKIVHYSGPVPGWVPVGALFWSWWTRSLHRQRQHHQPRRKRQPRLVGGGRRHPSTISIMLSSSAAEGPPPTVAPSRRLWGWTAPPPSATNSSPGRSDGQGCWFPGTSQSSPHVAGMAALVRQRFPELTAEQVAAYLKDNAAPRGAVPNNTWGYGFAQLPAEVVGGCINTITTDGATDGQWSAGCHSRELERGFAQYYTFTLEEDAQVAIDVTSSGDPYVFLRARRIAVGGLSLRKRRHRERKYQFTHNGVAACGHLHHRSYHLRYRRNGQLHPNIHRIWNGGFRYRPLRRDHHRR